jgi:hypothetical protein
MLSEEIINGLDKRFEKYTLKTKNGTKFLTNDDVHFRMSFEEKGEHSLDNSLWVLELDVEFISDNFDMYNYEAADVLGQWFSKKYKVKISNVSQVELDSTKIIAINKIENVT